MFDRLMKEESGFTLVELLVVIAILGVLFGAVSLTLSGVGSDAQAAVALAECGVVQSAADIYLAADTANTIAGRATVGVIDTGDAEFGIYLRDLPTQFTYSWDSAGDVTCADVP